MNESRNIPHAEADDGPAANRVCRACIGEPYLSELVTRTGKVAGCFYCSAETESITLKQLADQIERAFDEHYYRTPTNPDAFEAAMQADSGADYHWERQGEEVLRAIADAAVISDAVATDVLSVLEARHADRESAEMGDERPFAADSYYAEKDPGCEEFTTSWKEFVDNIQTKARFFSRSTKKVLDEVFADLATLMTAGGNPVVVTIGPNTDIKCLYRARVFAGEDEELKTAIQLPWKHLGPPPMAAASAGRMNARGISVFYGALDAETALAEVRPPVGSRVAVAKFAVERSLRLVDVGALSSVRISGSIFDSAFLRQLQRARFLSILSEQISRPVMPNDEAFDYLPTQAVAEYLENEVGLDGIIFPSVQVGYSSSNVVLFHRASRVQEIQVPHGTELSSYLESRNSDGVSPDYRVLEEVTLSSKAVAATGRPTLDSVSEDADSRTPSLKIDLCGIDVHHVTAARFKTESHSVHRQHLGGHQASAF